MRPFPVPRAFCAPVLIGFGSRCGTLGALMNDALKTFLIALVTAVVVQVALAPMIHKFYRFPVGDEQAQLAAPLGGQPVAPAQPAGTPTLQAPGLTAPHMEGMSVDDARERFRDKGIIIIEDGLRGDAAADPGTILQQRPAPGAPLTHMEVRVIVAKEQAGLQVPDVLGQPVDTGRTTLIEAGFEVPPPAMGSSDKPAGTIIKQVPNPGAKAPRGRKIHLIVATPGVVKVPKLRGKSLRTAKKLLEEAGLAVGSIRREEDPELGEGQVLRHSPKAGEEAPPGSMVDLVVVAPN